MGKQYIEPVVQCSIFILSENGQWPFSSGKNICVYLVRGEAGNEGRVITSYR